MKNLSKTQLGLKWLAAFKDENERETAALLMDEILLVNRDELIRGLRQEIEKIIRNRNDSKRPIALFAERAVPKLAGVIQPYFPNSRTGRASGPSLPPLSIDAPYEGMGSEGVIANLITDLARHHGSSILDHPGPDIMRSKKPSHIIVVTDFIGSGKRVNEMLEAFRAVATLRSWRSYKRISFHVVSYSGTDEGVRIVKSNRLKPTVLPVIGCPTIFNIFKGAKLSQICDLCRHHPSNHKHPLGYMHGGALIAFAHGMPNNAPPILHSKVNGWKPLFRGRSTSGAELEFPLDAKETVSERATRLLRIRNAEKHLSSITGKRWVATMMILAAIEAGAKSISSLSARSGLTLSHVEEVLSYTRIARWTTSKNALTRLGREELALLRRRRKRTPVLPKTGSPFYYPTQLRAR